MIESVNFVFIPENSKDEEITSKKFKDQCSLQFAYLVETIKKVIGGKKKSYTLRTPLSVWGIAQAEGDSTGETEGDNTFGNNANTGGDEPIPDSGGSDNSGGDEEIPSSGGGEVGDEPIPSGLGG